MMMNGASDHVLTNSALTGQQHSGPGWSNTHNGCEDLAHGLTASDQVIESIARAQLFLELPVLVAKRPHFESLLHHGR